MWTKTQRKRKKERKSSIIDVLCTDELYVHCVISTFAFTFSLILRRIKVFTYESELPPFNVQKAENDRNSAEEKQIKNRKRLPSPNHLQVLFQ